MMVRPPLREAESVHAARVYLSIRVGFRGGLSMIMVADVGATKTVIACASGGPGGLVLASAHKFHNDQYDSFESVLAAYIKAGGIGSMSAIGVAAAGAVVEGTCRLTNLEWTIDTGSLAAGFGFSRVVILNDLQAGAYGIDYLSEDAFETIHPGQPSTFGNRVLISPGTGLGEAIIHGHNGRYFPIAGEGGHADFAPYNGETVRLWEYIHRARGSVRVEDLLSGPGIAAIYNFLTEEGDGIDETVALDPFPEQTITRRALSGEDGTAIRTVRLFFDILAAEARIMALKTLSVGGVFFGGGVIPRLTTLLDRARFLGLFCGSGPHRELLSRIPLRVITDTDLPLYGAAAFILSTPE